METLASSAGFEPATLYLGGICSIQLSYEDGTSKFYVSNECAA